MIRNLRLPSSLQQGHVNKFLTVQFSYVQRNLWVLHQKCIPTAIRDADKAFILYFSERLTAVSLAGMPASGVAYRLNKSQTKAPFN
jgi:hypothetical protein